MKSILSIQTIFLSVFLLGCSNDHKQEEVKPGKSKSDELEKTEISRVTKSIEKMSSAFEARINSIRTEKNKTEQKMVQVPPLTSIVVLSLLSVALSLRSVASHSSLPLPIKKKRPKQSNGHWKKPCELNRTN